MIISTISRWPYAAAMCRATRPSVVRSHSRAPRPISSRAAAVLPVKAAMTRGLRPVTSLAFTLTPGSLRASANCGAGGRSLERGLSWHERQSPCCAVPAWRVEGRPGYCLRTLEGGGGGGLASPGRPTHPPTHIRKTFLRQKMKFIKGAGNLRPILGPQFFFGL